MSSGPGRVHDDRTVFEIPLPRNAEGQGDEPARVHDSRNVFEISLPRDPGCECDERAGVAGIKVVEAVHGASWYEQGVARFQSMRHPVERDCQRPAETIPNFFEIAMI